MDAQAITRLMRSQMGWRIGPHTARYILDQLAAGAAGPVAVLAADARTGLPARPLIDPQALAPHTPRHGT